MKKTILLLAILFLLMPIVSSSTTVKLKTLPGHDVFISALKSDLITQIQDPKKTVTGLDGIATYVYDGTAATFGIRVIVKYQGVQVYRETYGPFPIGEEVQLPNLLPDDWVDQFSQESDSTGPTEEETVAIETPEPQDQAQNETNSTNSSNITGNAIQTEIVNSRSFSLDSNLTKIIYYVLGGIFILGIISAIIVFVMMRVRRSPSPEYGMQPVKLHSSSKGYGDRDLDKIEKEIANVENEIVNYQKKNRLQEAEQRLQERKAMLEKMKRGESNHSHQTKLSDGHRESKDSRKDHAGYRKKVMGY